MHRSLCRSLLLIWAGNLMLWSLPSTAPQANDVVFATKIEGATINSKTAALRYPDLTYVDTCAAPRGRAGEGLSNTMQCSACALLPRVKL